MSLVNNDDNKAAPGGYLDLAPFFPLLSPPVSRSKKEIPVQSECLKEKVKIFGFTGAIAAHVGFVRLIPATGSWAEESHLERRKRASEPAAKIRVKMAKSSLTPYFMS
ncbi:hypothetical protein D8B26_003763 [Coccidioides posadasii str. Silveira]|uniref:uncharacterized protein n=1 Tax=Coccidioides posadasii (strain RMSCC 757 / Silveira) TaxID=443226 RepID=UPI001BEEDF49|nr:hypothetical protein D8B26_003763 [Coccidioides posadasii str. Silveira]